MANNAVYPLATKGEIKGVPYQGSHTLFGNWESDNAVDIAVPKGTPVYAVQGGIIGNQIGSLGSNDPHLGGLRLHLVTRSNEFYYAHLSQIVVHAGDRVRVGQLLGYSGEANGLEHLHFASKNGNPEKVLKLPITTETQNAPPPPTPTPTTPDQSAADEASREAAIQQRIAPLQGGDLAGGVGASLPEPGAAPAIEPPVLPPTQTWSLIASLPGGVSPDTQRLAALSQLSSNG